MGIAKTMNATGEYNFHSSDFNQFIEELGQLFHINIHASFFDHHNANGIEPEDTDDKF